MFSMTKHREFGEVQRQDADVNRRHYGEDVKFDQITVQCRTLTPGSKALPTVIWPETIIKQSQPDQLNLLHIMRVARVFLRVARGS